MHWNDLHFAFWHPFGPYCGLTEEKVLNWKRSEVERHGWTFWSFAYARTAEKWHQLLLGQDHPVHVLCSFSPTATDPFPDTKPPRATHYRFLNDPPGWEPMPTGDRSMFVTNPFKRQGLATAFKVTRVDLVEPPVAPNVMVEWYARGKGEWSSHRLPTRGEFLVRRGGSASLRTVCAVLEISPPYLAVLKNDELGIAA